MKSQATLPGSEHVQETGTHHHPDIHTARGEQIPEASHLSDLWGDRRRRQESFDGPDRRSGRDRRNERTATATGERRGKSVARELWRSGRLERLVLIAGDLSALVLSFIAAWTITVGQTFPGATGDLSLWWADTGAARVVTHTLLSLVVVSVFWGTGQYAKRIPFWDELQKIGKVLLAVACLDAAVAFFGQWQFSRTWLLTTWTIALLMVPFMRILTKHTLMTVGGWMRPTVIIGTGENAREAARALRSEPLLGFQLAGFMAPPVEWGASDEADIKNGVIEVGDSRLPVYRMKNEPGALLEQLGKPHVVVALDGGHVWKVAELLHKSRASYSSLNIVPSLRGLPLVGTEIMHFFRHEVLLLQVQNNLARKMPQRIKRAFDIVVSATSLVLLSPLFALVSWRIMRKGTSPFYGHLRVGQDGKPFKCYKFQSMVANADEVLKELLERDEEARKEWEHSFKLKNDPRVTRIGAFLRRTSLDELPQLWNVLKGEMSLVGPRPIIQQELERYGDHYSYYLKAKPGITGLWQISGRSDASYRERVALDIWYAKNWTLWYDIVILLKTVREVLLGKGAY